MATKSRIVNISGTAQLSHRVQIDKFPSEPFSLYCKQDAMRTNFGKSIVFRADSTRSRRGEASGMRLFKNGSVAFWGATTTAGAKRSISALAAAITRFNKLGAERVTVASFGITNVMAVAQASKTSVAALKKLGKVSWFGVPYVTVSNDVGLSLGKVIVNSKSLTLWAKNVDGMSELSDWVRSAV